MLPPTFKLVKVVASDFHAVESRHVLKLRVKRFEIAGDVCRDEVNRSLEHNIAEKGGVSDFYAVEVGALFLVLKPCPICLEVAGDVCPDKVNRSVEHSIVERGVASDFHALEIGLCLKRAVLK